MNLPNILRLSEDGTLYCTDGRDVKEYLKQSELPIAVPLVLVERAAFEVDLRVSRYGWAA